MKQKGVRQSNRKRSIQFVVLLNTAYPVLLYFSIDTPYVLNCASDM